VATEAVIAVRGLGVRFGATLALDDLDLDLLPRRVHALVGENGAGKSTLLRVLAGVIEPSAGSLTGAAEVSWVPQETELPGDLTVRDWIFLGREARGRLGWLRHRHMETEATRILRTVGADIAPAARLGSLAAAERKLVQIARALYGQPPVLLLDEPTAVLGDHDAARLFHLIRQLRDAGACVVYVSHRLAEVLALADEVTVLRDGRRVSTDTAAAVDVSTLVQRMVGRPIAPRGGRSVRAGERLLHVEHVSDGSLRGVSLHACAGEIVGLAGLVGAGRSELLEAICGLRRIRSGTVRCSAAPVLLPEDRNRNGLVAPLSLRENVFLPAPGFVLNTASERQETNDLIDRLHIRAGGSEASMASLSGGNQQKVLLARALRRRPRLLLLDEPTAGVDVGAKAEIHAILAQLATDGAAIVLASSDLPELLSLADRIVALRDGRVAGAVDAERATEAQIAAWITGSDQPHDAEATV
jgi:ABC-type sugar transport system ATPase subunit